MVTYEDVPEVGQVITRWHDTSSKGSTNVVVQVVSTVRWMFFVSEAARFDAHIRLQRWHKRIDHLADAKRRVERAFTHSRKVGKLRGLVEWKQWAGVERTVKDTARRLSLKRSFIHKWRVEFMALAQRLNKIRNKVREHVDPIMAAKIRGFSRLEEPQKVKKMMVRASNHFMKWQLRSKWLAVVMKKKALQAKIDSIKATSEEQRAKIKFWAQLALIMDEVRTRQRAASAFTQIAPRRGLNSWKQMLELRHEGRRLLVWIASQDGLHLDHLSKMLIKVAPGIREDLLCQTDDNGLSPLMWAAKRGQTAAAELILSFGGRLGNGANTKDLVCAQDNEGVTALHHAARGGHNGVLNALLVLASTLDLDIVDATNVEGSTAMHWAARKNNVPALRMLLQHGAQRDRKNKWGATPLDNALHAPQEAHAAVAVLSRDAVQIQAALKTEALQRTLRPTEEEKKMHDEYLAEAAAQRREADKLTLINLKTARLEGWLGWHQQKQDPEVVMPENRMRNADIALARALAPPSSQSYVSPTGDATSATPMANTEGELFASASTLVPATLKGVQVQQEEAAPVDVSTYDTPAGALTSPAISPARHSLQSPTTPGKGPRPWLGYTPKEHAELLRALEEAVAAGNAKCGIQLYEDRVDIAMRTCRLLKRDGRLPARLGSPLNSVRASHRDPLEPEERLAKEEAQRAKIETAINTARRRAVSPPAAVRSLRAATPPLSVRDASRAKSSRSSKPRLSHRQTPSSRSSAGSSAWSSSSSSSSSTTSAGLIKRGSRGSVRPASARPASMSSDRSSESNVSVDSSGRARRKAKPMQSLTKPKKLIFDTREAPAEAGNTGAHRQSGDSKVTAKKAKKVVPRVLDPDVPMVSSPPQQTAPKMAPPSPASQNRLSPGQQNPNERFGLFMPTGSPATIQEEDKEREDE